MGRPDVLASFSHRAKVKREWLEQAAIDGVGLTPSVTGGDAGSGSK
ncbi:MAG: hypothetical protein ACI82F_002018 [Planctomycetota bacterium]|jgi:hypothetical protein